MYAAVTHGVLSQDAVKRINESQLEKLLITDSIPLTEDKKSDKIEVLSLAPLFAKIIEALEEGLSLHEVHQKYIAENK